MRLVYADGTVEMDFMTRRIRNGTHRPLRPLHFDDPLGESISSFLGAVRGGRAALVRPQEARDALETALMVEQAVLTPSRRPAEWVAAVA
jgi:hypothetical protein